MKILALSTSNSLQSINQAFATWAAKQLAASNIQIRNMNDYEMPIYSPQREQECPKPDAVRGFLSDVEDADIIIIGYAEHNGNFTAAWKNVSDWVSRSERRFFLNKPVLALATSPGKGGAASVLALGKAQVAHSGGDLVEAISLPSYQEHYNENEHQVTHQPTLERMRQVTQSLNDFESKKTKGFA